MNIDIRNANRLGNFIIQIKNAIHIGLFYNYNIILPKHTFFNTTYLVINNKITLKDKKITNKHNFFCKDKIEKIDKTLFKKNKDEVITIMKKIFVYNNIPPLGNNDLVIHIRSGDIFKKNPHKKYLTPPLSYYINIIEKNSYDNIYLISEDKLNPCINRLLELFPKIIFNLQSLEQDIKIILGANNLVMSYGTFIPQLLNFSSNIKNIYIPSYVKFRIKHTGIVHITDLKKYYTLMIPWKNTIKQKKIMLNYK
jgi:hypothetical protein